MDVGTVYNCGAPLTFVEFRAVDKTECYKIHSGGENDSILQGIKFREWLDNKGYRHSHNSSIRILANENKEVHIYPHIQNDDGTYTRKIFLMHKDRDNVDKS